MCEGGAGRGAAEDGDAGWGVGGHVEQTSVKLIKRRRLGTKCKVWKDGNGDDVGAPRLSLALSVPQPGGILRRSFAVGSVGLFL